MAIISHEILAQYVYQLLCHAGADPVCAQAVSQSLVEAELRGIATHGVSRLGIYLQRMNAGGIDGGDKVTILSESPSALSIDGGNGFGAHVATYAMERCIPKALETGSCFASVGRSSHFGTAAQYALMATERGCIGIVCTNLTGKIAPYGSTQAYMGTNPIAIAVPSADYPVVLDMTPSVVALGKIILAQKLEKPIPEGWALDNDGNPTTDPTVARAGSLLPLGGAKGSGLAMMIDILSGLLSDGNVGPQIGDLYGDDSVPQGVGHFMGAISVAHFTDLDTFCRRVAQMRQEIKTLPLAAGFQEILLPGERSHQQRLQYLEQGIPVPDAIYQELLSLGAPYGLGL